MLTNQTLSQTSEAFLKTFPLGITLKKPVVPSELKNKMMQLHVVVNYYMHMHKDAEHLQ